MNVATQICDLMPKGTGPGIGSLGTTFGSLQQHLEALDGAYQT